MDYDRLLKRYLTGDLSQEEFDGLSKKTKQRLEKDKKIESFKNSLRVISPSGHFYGGTHLRNGTDTDLER